MTEQKVKPFLKWVGGKTSTLPKLIEQLPTKFGNYYEPFLGGGALFFAVDWQDKSVYLNDINKPYFFTSYTFA